MWRRRRTPEGSVARWAAVALGSSFVVPSIAVFAVLGASAYLTPIGVLVLTLAAAYLAHIFLLDSIERFTLLGRRRIWMLSAILHAPVLTLGVVAAALWSWGILILLLPEFIGGILIAFGIRLHAKGAQIA